MNEIIFYNGFNLLIDILLVTIAITTTYNIMKERQND